MSDWQPIDTAPDDQFILVWAPHLSTEIAIKCEGRFHVTCDEMYPIYTCDEDEEKIVLGTYVTMPTHWMPLPAPPATKTTGSIDCRGHKINKFVVKHYTSDERPTIKGNGFDGLEVGEDRWEAEEFIEYVNGVIEQLIQQENSRLKKALIAIAPDEDARSAIAAANARLIAAAPEMLEALEEAEVFIDSHSEDWYRSGQELLSKVRAAIKKAKGEL